MKHDHSNEYDFHPPSAEDLYEQSFVDPGIQALWQMHLYSNDVDRVRAEQRHTVKVKIPAIWSSTGIVVIQT